MKQPRHIALIAARKLLTVWIVLAAIVGASAPASAQMGMTGIGGGGFGAGGGGGSFAVAWQYANVIDGGFGSPVTFTSVPLGTAASDRIVNVHINSYFGGVTAVAIGAVNFTLGANDGASPPLTSSWYANVPTGTSGNIVVTGAGFADLGIMVWTMTGQTGGGSATPTNGAYSTNPNGGGNPNQIAVTVSAGGAALVTSAGSGYASAQTESWANTTSSGGDGAARDTGAQNLLVAGAHATASATVTVTQSPTAWGFGAPIIYQSWGP